MSRLEVRNLAESEVEAAETIMRRAFGTFIGIPEPESFGGDSSYVRSRWLVSPERVFGGFLDGELVGSNIATCWGSFGFFGPLSVEPRYWDQGYASVLMEPIIETFGAAGLRGSGLFTFPHSAKHIGLYQKFGFRPGHLNLVLHKNLEASGQAYASAGSADPTTLKLCREISGAVLDGLDLSDEIQGACEQGFGEAVVSESGNGFALCHVGAGSEAGSGTAYVKFGAVRPGPDANRDFAELLDAAEGFAERSGAGMLVAGVSAGRRRAYEALLDRGYRILLTGLSMHRPGEPLFADPEHFVLDDWR